MSLTRYNKKRDFKQTSEPGLKKGLKKGDHLAFVVQRHDATHLHYDFRLEMEGFLKSWAVPKGPSMNPGDKRLAIMVEDHPYDYKNFYGTIPKGNYGAGEVEIWDEGIYTDLEESDKKTAERKLLAGLKKGEIKFRLYGKKLKGEFVLVKLKGREDNQWLLIKHHDKYAIEKAFNIENITSLKKPRAKKETVVKAVSSRTLREKKEHFIKPMLARETSSPFDNDEWVFEIKWDGYRAIAEVKNKNVELYSRNGLSFNSAYPIVIEHLAKMKLNAVLDGEVVALNEEGVPSFQLLQQYLENPDLPLVYYVFDLLRKKNKDLTRLPLIERKALLKKLLKKDSVIRYSDHIDEKGVAFFRTASERNLEGIMAKKKDSTYEIGTRTSNWLKIKNQNTDEAIIIGYTEPRKSRKYFGSLLLGRYNKGELEYVGHVGTGFNNQMLKDLYYLMQPLQVESSPLKKRVKTNSPAHWVKPSLVAAVRFTEWTSDGQMRQPAFLGLREDLSAKEVRKEPGKKVKSLTGKKIKRKRSAA